MKTTPKITRIEIVEFEYEIKDLGREATIGGPVYKPGDSSHWRAAAIRIDSSVGLRGEYMFCWAEDFLAVRPFAPLLIGRNALEREEIYNDVKFFTRGSARMGQGVVDIALWDLAGKYYETPVYELLGGSSKKKLPCYASSYPGDYEKGGLNTPEAFADFAERCLEMGYRGFKIHPWYDSTIEDQIALVHTVGQRVGGKMDLMTDPFNAIKTFGEALKLGWACDEEKFFWLEDPLPGGVSIHAHRELRKLIRTPLLQLEQVRGLEPHVDFIEAGATDFVRADPVRDGGVTGVMKLAHATEGFGLDVEIHFAGPVHRHLMAAISNTNYYEMGLLHPALGPEAGLFHPPVYKDGYRDAIDSIDDDGCVQVPEGPGLGVEHDWDFIMKHRVASEVFE